MVVDTAPVSKAIDLPTAGDEMVYSSLSSWPVPRSRTNVSVLAAARALVQLIVYRFGGCCGKAALSHAPSGPTKDDRIFVFADRSDHIATGSPQTSRKSLVLRDGAFREEAPMRRAPHALNRSMRDDCSLAGMHAERRPVDSAGGHCKGLHIVDVLTLIDEIAKLAFALGKRNALDQHRKTNSCSYPRYSSNSAQHQIATLGTPGLAAAERTSRKRAPRGSLADLDLSPRGPRTIRRAQQHQKKRPMSFIASSGSAAS